MVCCVYLCPVLQRVAASVLCGVRYLVKKHEDDQVDGEPIRRVVAVNEV